MKFSALFDKLQDTNTLKKAKEYSRWTVPSLVAEPLQDGKSAEVIGDFQSDGAVLVNGLASKLAGLLFPSTHPFMKINLDAQDLEIVTEAGISQEEVNAAFAKLENDASQRVFNNASFNQLVLALKHLIVTGNVMLYRDSEHSRTVCYGLNKFAVRRDGLGRVVDAVVKETTFYELLDEETQMVLMDKYPGRFESDKPYDKELTMYTRILRQVKTGPQGQDQFSVAVQIEDVDAPATYMGTYSEYTCPWIFPTWSLVTGENYGRGLVEDHAGGFAKISEVSYALGLYEVESLRLINLVGNSAANSKDELAQADTGAWVGANPEDVAAYESGSTQKLQVILGDLEAVFGKLARAFMYQGNTRDAERVDILALYKLH